MKHIFLSILTIAAALTMNAKVPIIGVSGFNKDGNGLVGRTYINAVLNAGGAPVIIPVTGNDEVIESIVSTLDGLIMTGGVDFDPLKYYGEEPIQELGEVDPARDEFDVKLVRAAVKKGIPVLGICRGHQLLSVAFGGSLWQDIPSQIPGSFIKHRQSPTPGAYGSHTVNIVKGSFLEKIFGEDTAIVNSFHHQAIKDMPKGFKVVATSVDGIIEGIERVAPLEGYPDGGGLILGVQFHPESMVTGPDKTVKALFELLVESANQALLK